MWFRSCQLGASTKTAEKAISIVIAFSSSSGNRLSRSSLFVNACERLLLAVGFKIPLGFPALLQISPFKTASDLGCGTARLFNGSTVVFLIYMWFYSVARLLSLMIR